MDSDNEDDASWNSVLRRIEEDEDFDMAPEEEDDNIQEEDTSMEDSDSDNDRWEDSSDDDDDDDDDNYNDDERAILRARFFAGDGNRFFLDRVFLDDDDSSSEEEENGNETIHYGVSCDECGASSLRGTVYHSTRIIDYDICQECYEENHKHLTLADAFLVITKRYRRIREEEYFEEPRAMRVDASGWTALEETLTTNPRVQNLDVNFSVYAPAFEALVEERRQAIQTGMTNCNTLKVFYAEFPSRDQPAHSEAITALLQGISDSSSIITLSIALDFAWQSAIQDLCQLIQHNKSIRYLFLRHKQPPVSLQERLQERARQRRASAQQLAERAQTLQNEQQARDQQAKASAGLLLQALAQGTSSLHSFVCTGVSDLPDATAAIRALRNRPSLKRIKADFWNPNDNATLLELTAAKKERWMRNWNDPAASNDSRVEILGEVLSCKQVDPEDQVAALFHFVRSNPGSLPELQE